MEKLYNYLLKIGIDERPKRGNLDEPPAIFYRELFGNSNYFYNAPNHTHAGAVVTLNYNAEAAAEYSKNLIQIEKSLQTYCKKYNYYCRRDTCHHSKTVYFYIEKQTDRDAATTYYYYMDSCREECEQAAHELYIAGRPEKVEATLREIMQKWGAAYNERLNADETKRTVKAS